MFFSHHPPSHYDRTFRIGGLRICTRCFGSLLGASIIALVQVRSHILGSVILIWSPLFLPLPAVFDFLAHELELWRSDNVKRLVSGLLLGFAMGLGGYNLLSGNVLWGVLQVTWLVVLEFAAAVVLKYTSKMDEYIERYEKGVLR